MRTVLTILLSLLCVGCTMIQKISSPSQTAYASANSFYEEKNYVEAIVAYKKFIDENPQSSLLIPAQLNLGMSYFYSDDYKNAYATLKAIDLKDVALKAYVDKILKQCEEQLGPEATTQVAAASGSITINNIVAYLDDVERYNSVVLTGTVDKPSTVFVNGVKAPVDANHQFQITTPWKKGQPIIITAQDDAQNTGRLEYYPDSEAPKEPHNLRVTNKTNNSVEFEWDENSEKDIYGYKIFYRLKNGEQNEAPEIARTNKYEIIGLENMVRGANKTFQFYIKAVDTMGNYSNSSDILETTLP